MFFDVQVSEQQVRMEVWLRQKLLASLSFPQVGVSDGEWHHLLVELRSIKDGKDIKYMATVSLDYDMYQVWTPASLHMQDFCCQTFELFISGVSGDRKRPSRSEVTDSLCGRSAWRQKPCKERICWLHTGNCGFLSIMSSCSLPCISSSLSNALLQGVRMGETPTNVANPNIAQGLKIRVEDGCSIADPCDSNICPENSHCHDDWSTHTCVCNPGNT